MRKTDNINKNHIKDCKIDKCFDVLNFVILAMVFLVTVYPLFVILSSSFSDPMALTTGKVKFLPVGFNLEGYKAVMEHKRIWSSAGNSIFYTVVGTAVNMVMTIIAAYPLSRNDFRPKNFLALMFAFTMWFSGGLIPAYLLVRDLGMYNTRMAMIIPGALSVWNMIIVRTYFQTSISQELFESARLDGCDDIRYLLDIALPISKPVLAVVTLYYAVGHWNSYFGAYIYLQRQDLHPLQIVLRDILLLSQMQDMSINNLDPDNNAQQMSELLKYSLVIVSSLPMTIIYLLTQKYFEKGIMVGAVKG